MSPRVLIVVEGGVVAGVFADGPVVVCIKDWDVIRDGGATDFMSNPVFSTKRPITSRELNEMTVDGVGAYVDKERAAT